MPAARAKHLLGMRRCRVSLQARHGRAQSILPPSLPVHIQKQCDLKSRLVLPGPQGLRGAALAVAVASALEAVALEGVADRHAGGYSGGMRRRLSVACALVGPVGREQRRLTTAPAWLLFFIVVPALTMALTLMHSFKHLLRPKSCIRLQGAAWPPVAREQALPPPLGKSAAAAAAT